MDTAPVVSRRSPHGRQLTPMWRPAAISTWCTSPLMSTSWPPRRAPLPAGPVDLARAAAVERDVFAPIPIGVGEDGQQVRMNMPGDNGRHVLAIGASGAGKTTFMHPCSCPSPPPACRHRPRRPQGT